MEVPIMKNTRLKIRSMLNPTFLVGTISDAEPKSYKPYTQGEVSSQTSE